MVRKIFYYDGYKEKPITSGGILFYKDDKLLMIKCQNKYEDFGGKSEMKDKNIYEMVAREVNEESNGIFKEDYLIDIISKLDCIYISRSKYVLFFVELKDDYLEKDFGKYELHDKIKRTVKWVNIRDFKKIKKNFRLCFKHVDNKVNYILTNYYMKDFKFNMNIIPIGNTNKYKDLVFVENNTLVDSGVYFNGRLICKHLDEIKKEPVKSKSNSDSDSDSESELLELYEDIQWNGVTITKKYIGENVILFYHNEWLNVNVNEICPNELSVDLSRMDKKCIYYFTLTKDKLYLVHPNVNIGIKKPKVFDFKFRSVLDEYCDNVINYDVEGFIVTNNSGKRKVYYLKCYEAEHEYEKGNINEYCKMIIKYDFVEQALNRHPDIEIKLTTLIKNMNNICTKLINENNKLKLIDDSLLFLKTIDTMDIESKYKQVLIDAHYKDVDIKFNDVINII
jgi:hypothetical protein